jgi:hypothetical protein
MEPLQHGSNGSGGRGGAAAAEALGTLPGAGRAGPMGGTSALAGSAAGRGRGPGPRAVCAAAWYDSPAYREVRKHRFLGADYSAVIVEGV